MKKLKRIFGMLLVVAMLLVQIIPTTNVKAAADGKITVNNAKVGETYSIYKILSLESYDKDADTYVYKVAEGWEKFISTGAGSQYLTIVDDAQDTNDDNTYVIWKEEVEKDSGAKALAAAAIEYVENDSEDDSYSVSATESKTATSETVEFSNLDLGYYLVDSTLGAICGLTTTNPESKVNEKNTVPTVVKEVEENSTKDYGETNDAKIGDTVNYKTTITVGEGTENYVLYDNMSTGLTLNENSFKITVNGKTVDSANYTIEVPGVNEETFTISFENDYITSLEPGTEIIVEYSAILNKEAVIEGEGNPNETWLKYGNAGETTHDTTITYTYAFNLIKVNSSNEQLTATFRLYDSVTGGNEIAVVWDEENNYYRVAVEGEEGVIITAGNVTIVGLDDDTYYLEEIEAPLGYNKLSSRVQINISRINEETQTYQRLTETVVNYTGSELPTTGGMGTTIFIVLGLTMIIGFGVALIAKLRMSKANI